MASYLVTEALKGSPKEASILNQMLLESGHKITWGGETLGDSAEQQNKAIRQGNKNTKGTGLVVNHYLTIEESGKGDTELGGGWFVSYHPELQPVLQEQEEEKPEAIPEADTVS